MKSNIKLKDIAILKNGKKRPEENFGKYEVYGANGKIGYSNEYLLVSNSIVIGRVGANCGSVHFSNKPIWISDNTIGVIPNDTVDSYYLYYYLKSLRLNEMASGSAQPLINQSIINSIDLNLISFTEQKKVGHLLRVIDDKLLINRNIINNLKEISQNIFNQWFINFEFLNDQGQPYRLNDGEMIESELGLIPKNWSTGTINDIGSVVGGGTPSKKYDEYYTSNGISWITPKDLSLDKSTYIYKGTIDITELGLKKGSAKILPKNTVLFSSRAPIGYIAIAGQKVTTNQGFKSIVPDKGYSPYYIYHLLHQKLPYIEAAAGGSTFKEISGKGLKEIPIILPPVEVTQKFESIVEAIFLEIQTLEMENKKLEELRDTLLPKLLSGEIKI